MKSITRLTEADLHNIIRKSVNEILNEYAIKDAEGNETSVHGGNSDDWDKMASLRSKKHIKLDNLKKSANDEYLKKIYDKEIDRNANGFLTNTVNAINLRNKGK